VNALANLSVRGKLYTLLGTALIGLTVYAVVAGNLTQKVQVNGPIYRNIVMGKDLVADILPPPEYIIESYLTVLQLEDPANHNSATELAGHLKQLENDYSSRHEYWIKTLPDGSLKQAMTEQSYEPARRFFSIANDELLPAVNRGDYELAHKTMDRMTAAYVEHRAAIDKVVTMANDFSSDTEKGAADQISSGMTILIGIAACTLAFVIALGLIIANSISRPVVRVVAAAEQMNREFQDFERVLSAIANNDLTQPIPEMKTESLNIASNDEIGRLGRAIETTIATKLSLGKSAVRMKDNLTQVITKLGENARELVSAATEIASSSEQMSKGARDQADQVNQVSTAVEEMTATILESSRNAGEATTSSRNASETAAGGGRVVNDTITGMQQIADVVRQSAQSITKLASSADRIGEIIAVIDDIADQTNLLALNAAIEAARAGEQGRGFAVVADEVRKLAERTGKATGEITNMIKGIQRDTEEAVGSMESGIQQVDRGRDLADKAGSSLNEIVVMVQRVTDMIQQIATAAEEQSTAAEQISKNIEHISSVTRETATGAEQSAAAADQLSHQAENLQQMVAKFRVVG
jgi:methyl-accepting chemotaxis protein